jgi:hypothetical protein
VNLPDVAFQQLDVVKCGGTELAQPRLIRCRALLRIIFFVARMFRPEMSLKILRRLGAKLAAAALKPPPKILAGNLNFGVEVVGHLVDERP